MEQWASWKAMMMMVILILVILLHPGLLLITKGATRGNWPLQYNMELYWMDAYSPRSVLWKYFGVFSEPEGLGGPTNERWLMGQVWATGGGSIPKGNRWWATGGGGIPKGNRWWWYP